MHFSCRIALVLGLSLAASHVVLAQQSSSTDRAAEQLKQAQVESSLPPLTVEARIKARREQRRRQVLQDTYGHRMEIFAGSGMLNFLAGSTHVHKANETVWAGGVTRYFTPRLGAGGEFRANFGHPFVEPQPYNSNFTHPLVNQYELLIGPTYRFYLHPKYSVSGRVMAGFSHGHFSGAMSNDQTLSTYLGLYPDSTAFAGSVAVIGEYNVSPAFALRVAPEFAPTTFGSTVQANFGGTAGFVFRFGKQ
jgi:hypothetical protein